jgi:hypothetical protein
VILCYDTRRRLYSDDYVECHDLGQVRRNDLLQIGQGRVKWKEYVWENRAGVFKFLIEMSGAEQERAGTRPLLYEHYGQKYLKY